MIEPETTVELKIFSSNASVSLTIADLTVSRIKIGSSQPPSPSSKPKTCPVNWIMSKVAKKCFSINNDIKNWEEADSACADFGAGGSLVSIDSAFENSEVTGEKEKSRGINLLR